MSHPTITLPRAGDAASGHDAPPESPTAVHASAIGETPWLGIVTKRAYRLRAGRLVDGVPVPLLREARFRELGQDDVALVADSDLLSLHKPTTDVLLDGSAHSHRGPVRELHTALVAGPCRKEVLVIGDRQLLVRADESLTSTRPAAFERMHLGWERAYGGRDTGAEPPPDMRRQTSVPSHEALLTHATFSYPRNRQGTGFFLDRDRRRLDGAALPNLSDPGDVLTLDRLLAADPCDWIDRPLPASYGPIGPLTFPRCHHYGLAIACSRRVRPVREVALGALCDGDIAALDDTREVDARAFNCAPPGLATARLLGHETVELFNLHRAAEHFVFALPGERPRMVLEPPHAGTYELEPQLATVLIEPDVDRVTLTWAGATRAAGLYTPDACRVMRHAVVWN